MELNSIFGSCMIGLGLCVPNIFVQLIMCCLKKNTASWQNIIMNILLHMAHANIIGKFINFGDKISLIVGIACISLYVLLLCFFVAKSGDEKYQRNTMYTVLNLLGSTENLEYLDEVISRNRKFPLRVFFVAAASHDFKRFIVDNFDNTIVSSEDMRYVGWDKNLEYFYKSWQDETKFLENASIVTAEFKLKVIFNNSAEVQRKKIMRDLEVEGRQHDRNVRIEERYFWDGQIRNKKYYINREEHMRIKKNRTCLRRFFGIILFILGYSSIFNSCCGFIVIEKICFIDMVKLISDEENLRAKYYTLDENIPNDLFEPPKKKEILDINLIVHYNEMEMLAKFFG